jgi:hypothetical protein
MKLGKLLYAALPAFVLVSAPASAATIDLTTLDGTWDIQDEFKPLGSFYTNDYFAPVALTAKFTDLYYSGDWYGIYVNGVLIGNASAPDGNFEADPDLAYASGLFAKGLVALNAGDILSFTMTRFPDGFDDGTIAVTLGSAVPEPASWALMIGGLGLVGMTMRRRSTTVSFA